MTIVMNDSCHLNIIYIEVTTVILSTVMNSRTTVTDTLKMSLLQDYMTMVSVTQTSAILTFAALMYILLTSII